MVLQWETVGLDPDFVDYQRAWDLQRELHEAVVSGRSPDTVLMLEHEAVYTAGRRTEESEKPADGAPVIDVDRGGKITWHGPGQLVGYPILRLPGPMDVVNYVRALEGALIGVCEHFGVRGTRIEGRSGVWLPAENGLPDRKIAAIGIRVSEGVTMHGFALNCSNSLDAYANIIACGIADAGATSLSAETGGNITPRDALEVTRFHLEERLSLALAG